MPGTAQTALPMLAFHIASMAFGVEFAKLTINMRFSVLP
jgi:hypothetical protein